MTNNQPHLQNLINQLCPNGVEFKFLWEVTAWDKRFNSVENHKQKKIMKYHYLLAGDLKSLVVENGNVKLLTTNISKLFTSEEIAGSKVKVKL